MQGYTHTCASCDAKLKIHERYVGRALHCPTCRTEFLADPTLADVDDILDDLVEEKKKPFPWVAAVLTIFVVTVMVLWLGNAAHEGLFENLFKPIPTVGQFAALGLEGRQTVPAAMDHETVIFVVDALEVSDPGSLEALKAQGRTIDVRSGTQVRVIEWNRREETARVRILEGPWTGRVVWVPQLAVR